MRWALLGNMIPPHSTENEWAAAIRDNGYDLDLFQEGDAELLLDLTMRVEDYDVIAWVRTKSLADQVGHDAQRRLIDTCAAAGIPLVGLHLDLWWGLRRQHEIATEPFFRVETLFTADGGHDRAWERAGVHHVWAPPAVSRFECEPGTARDEYRSDIAFVGSWAGGYHREWPHRRRLVRWLERTFPGRVRLWPRPGEPAVRGDALRDLYASVDVLVGDSCLVGSAGSYISDRVPETLGRGGFLIHPHVDGVTDGPLYTTGVHLDTWPLGDFDALHDRIVHALDEPEWRRGVAEAGRAHVLATATYSVRIRQVVDHLAERGRVAA